MVVVVVVVVAAGKGSWCGLESARIDDAKVRVVERIVVAHRVGVLVGALEARRSARRRLCRRHRQSPLVSTVAVAIAASADRLYGQRGLHFEQTRAEQRRRRTVAATDATHRCAVAATDARLEDVVVVSVRCFISDSEKIAQKSQLKLTSNNLKNKLSFEIIDYNIISLFSSWKGKSRSVFSLPFKIIDKTNKIRHIFLRMHV